MTIQIQDASGNLSTLSEPVTLTSTPAGINATITAANGVTTINNLVLNSPGNYTLTASSFGIHSTTSQSFTIGKVSQTITFPAISSQTYGGAPFTISATASSGLAVSFNSTTPAVCSVVNATVTILAAGTCTVTVSPSGDANNSAAAPVTQNVTIASANQSITFQPIPDQTLDNLSPTVSATASSGLPVSFAMATLGTCSLSGSTVNMLALGTCTINASQPGNANYNPAPAASLSFNINTYSRPNVINFPGAANQIYGTPPITLTVSTTSQLPVVLTSNTLSVCTLSGYTVTFLAADTCTITATQSGGASGSAIYPQPRP